MENRAKSPINAYFPQKSIQNPLRGSIMQNITNSSSLIFRRSNISTSKSKNSPANSQMDRSKIKTLPNYERYSMGNNLPFVTVFQTIEIERLSDEVETQRVKLKQFERLVFNAANFEIQIKQLSERCTNYEFEINQYREELDKMNKICQTLFHENENLKNRQKNLDVVSKARLEQQLKKSKQLSQQVQKWTKKYHMSEHLKQSEIQTIKSMMQKQRKSMIDRQIKDLQVKHQSEVAKLTVEIRRLNDVLLMKQRDIQDFKKKYNNSQDYIKQLKDYGSKLNEYEQKICLLSQQHLRLSQIIDVNVNELDMARKKQFKLTQQLNSEKQLTFDNEHLKALLQQKQRQLQNWKKKIIQLEEQVLSNKQLIHLNQQLQSKICCLNSENDKLVKLLKDRSAQIDKWKNVALQLQEENKKRREIQDLLIQKQAHYKVLQVQHEKVQNINKSKTKQFQELWNKYSVSQIELSKFNSLDKDYKNLEEKSKSQIERIMELQLHIQKLEGQACGSLQTNNKLRSAQSIIQSFKRQNERLQQKISQTQAQLLKIKQNQLNLGNQYSKLRETHTIISQYQEKIAIMSQQLNRLSELLKDKNDQISALEDQKINNYSIISQYKNLQSQLQDKQRVCMKLKLQMEQNQVKLKDYEQKMDEIDEKNKDLFCKFKQDLEMLQNQLKVKIKQCDDLKITQAKIQSQLLQKGELQKLCQKQKNRLTVCMRDLQDLKIQNKQYQANLIQQKKKLQQYERRSSVTSVGNTQTISNKSISSAYADPQQLLIKINKLELTLKDLSIKYADLLKQVSANSSSKIQTETPTSSLKNIQV